MIKIELETEYVGMFGKAINRESKLELFEVETLADLIDLLLDLRFFVMPNGILYRMPEVVILDTQNEAQEKYGLRFWHDDREYSHKNIKNLTRRMDSFLNWNIFKSQLVKTNTLLEKLIIVFLLRSKKGSYFHQIDKFVRMRGYKLQKFELSSKIQELQNSYKIIGIVEGLSYRYYPTESTCEFSNYLKRLI